MLFKFEIRSTCLRAAATARQAKSETKFKWQKQNPQSPQANAPLD